VKLARAGGNFTQSFGFLVLSLFTRAQQTARIFEAGTPTFTPPPEQRANPEAVRKALCEPG
jgi:hypothetical protein